MNGQRIYGLYVKWDIIQHKNEGNSAICDNINRPWAYYAKWNKLSKRNSIWYHLHVDQAKPTKQKNQAHRCRQQMISGCQRQWVAMGKMGEEGQKL